MPDAKILDSDQISRALARIAHEILERNGGALGVVLIGIHTRGVPLASRLSQKINEVEGLTIPVGELDISFYRDDISTRTEPNVRPTELPVPIDGQVIVLVDDVLYTGRSIRAAMDALNDFGRPRQIQLAVLVDRGHRELPIRPDYVGKNLPTSLGEEVKVLVSEVDGVDEVMLLRKTKV